jgi:hypothetical protein
MSISLYDVSVGTYLQIIRAASGVLDRGATHFKDKGVDTAEIVQTRLFPDMLPFSFQIASVAHHSIGAIDSLKSGVFTPPSGDLPADYAACQAKLADARSRLEALTPAEVDGLSGRDVVFKFGEMTMPFVAEGFILSFSLPNFYFHATTAYDILRTKGVPLGKRHFMGQLKMKA